MPTRSMPLPLICLCFLSVMVAQPVHAAGVVVRLVSSGPPLKSGVSVKVVNAEKTETIFVLLDDGQPPDVMAGDNQHSAAGTLTGTEATVFLIVEGKETEVGEVSWQDETTSRDLVITRGEGILTVENSAAMVTAALGGNVDQIHQEGGGGGLGPAPDPMDAGGTTPGGVVVFPEGSQQDDTTLYIIGGALVLVLAVAAFLWLRTPSTGGGASKSSRLYTVQPEPGLLGSTAPSLSDGLSTWRVGPTDTNDFLELLLQSMAQHHRVLVVASEETRLPVVHGGPIFLTRLDTAAGVADAAISLLDHAGLPLAVLVLRPKLNTAELEDFATVLTPDVGVVALLSEIEGGHRIDVEIARVSDGWHLRRGDTDVHIRLTEWGARVTPAGAPSAST